MVRAACRLVFGFGPLALLLTTLAPAPALGQTYTWNNFAGTAGSSDLLWSNNANWTAPPTFGQNAILSFASSDLQTASTYSANADQATVNANGLLFNFEGSSQASFITGGAPYFINLGNGSTASGLHMNPSSTGVAPSIIQNGAGAIAFRTNVAGSSMILEGTLPVQIGGTGIGSVEIASLIEMGATPTVPTGFVINFSPSAVLSNNSGATFTLTGAYNPTTGAFAANTFLGDVVLQNGNLNIVSSGALGQVTNRLIVNAGANSFRVTNSPTIANPVVLNSTMNFVSFDGSASTWTGAWSGTGGLNVLPGIGMTFNMFGSGGFTGPLVLRSQLLGYSGTGNDLVFNLGSSTGGATTGTLATTDLELFAGSRMVVTDANANATRLAAGTNLTMYRSSFALVANATAGNNAAETLTSLTNTGMSTIIATPQTATSATLTFGSWTRQSNATGYFVGTGLGGTPGANVGSIVFTTNPGGATVGSTIPGTQNLAVLPYAFGNSASTGNFVTSLVRYDAGTGSIVPLNTTTEYASNQTLANATGASGLNYRLAGAGSGGVAAMAGPVSLNGLVIDTNMASPAPPVGIALVGNSTLNLSGPVLSTFSGSGFPTGIGTFLPNQIAVAGLNFGANTAYFHTPGDLWVTSPISGSGGLVKSGDNGSSQANLYLLATNTFTGGLTINAGGVFFTADAQLGAAGGGILMNSAGNGGLFLTQMPFFDSTPAGSVTISRPLTLGAANGSMGAIVPGTTLTYAGAITGTGGLIVQTSGVTALTNAANSFVGDVVLRTGTTIVANDGALGNAANRILMGGFNSSGIFQPGPGFTSTNRDFIILGGANGTILTNGADFAINGVISNTQSYFGGPTFTKAGLGTLTLTAANTVSASVTVGDTAGTTSRATSPNGTQYGGTLRLSGVNGSLPLVSGYTVNNAAALTLDNAAAVNNDRIGIVGVGLAGGSLNLIGNAGTAVTEHIGAISTNDAGTITLTQPASSGGLVTTLSATAFTTGGSFAGSLFVRGTNLGAASGDRTQLLVTPTDLTTALPIVNGIVVGGFAAASDTAAGPTDLLAATLVTPAAVPNVGRYSLAPLATYGSLTAPGATVNADQAGSTFALAGPTDLNALRLGTGGGVDLGANTLTLGTATVNARAGTILATGGANAGITNGAIDFGAQPARIVTTSDLTIGTAASPTVLLGTNTSSSLVKSGPGTLTLFGTAATTLGVNGNTSGTVTVTEGTLALGNATALGRSVFNATSVAPIPNMLPVVVLLKGTTLDLSALSATPVRLNQIYGGGTVALGDTTLNTGNSSASFGGNITGSAASKYIVGISQAEIPFNTFGTGPALTGDNSGFLGQWEILRGTLNFASNLSFGTGTSPILFSDSATNGSTGSVSLRIDASLTVPFPRDVVVPTGGFALPTFLVGNSSNVSMTGNLTLGKAAAVVGTTGASGIFTFAGSISGPGQLILANASLSGSAGNIAIAGANPNWSGGVLMTGGGQTTTISSILAVGADNSLGTGTLTLGQFSGLLRADNGPRTLANAIDVTNTTPTAAFTTSFGTSGVNDIVFSGNVRGVLYQQFNIMPPSVPASPFTHTLNLNVINQGTTTFAGTISNGAAFNFGITKNGPGLVAVNGNNSYTGDTVVNAGTIRLGDPNALGFGGRQGMTAVAGVATVNSGAILDLNGQQNVNKPITLTGGSLVNNGTSPASIAGGTLASLTMTATGGATGTVPTVTLTGGGGSGATAVASLGLAPASFSFAALTQGGSGFSAVPSVSITGGGGAGATAAATLGVTSQTFTITNGGSGYTTAPSVTITSSGTSGAAAATATATITGGVVTAVTIVNPGTGYLFAPNITFGAAPAGGTTATGVGNATNFQVGSVVLTNPGGGFSTAPTFAFSGGGGSGATVTTNATNFALGLQMTAAGSGYTTAPTVGFSTGSATATANLSTVNLTANSSVGGSGPLVVNASITGTGSLTKIGAGVTTLSASNTYTGGTIVSAGTIAVVNTAGSGTGTGSVTVNPGGILQGTGSIAATGDVSVNGGAIKGGMSPGTLTISAGNLNVNANSAYVIELRNSGSFTAGAANSGASGTGGADNSRVTVSAGAFNLNAPGSLTVKVIGDASLFTAGQQYSFVVGSGTSVTGLASPITGTGAAPGQFDLSSFTSLFANSQFSLETSGNLVYMNFTPVPEPTAILLMGAASGLAVWVRRKRRGLTRPELQMAG